MEAEKNQNYEDTKHFNRLILAMLLTVFSVWIFKMVAYDTLTKDYCVPSPMSLLPRNWFFAKTEKTCLIKVTGEILFNAKLIALSAIGIGALWNTLIRIITFALAVPMLLVFAKTIIASILLFSVFISVGVIFKLFTWKFPLQCKLYNIHVRHYIILGIEILSITASLICGLSIFIPEALHARM